MSVVPLLPVRDVTQVYLKFRHEHKLRKNRFGYSLLKAGNEEGSPIVKDSLYVSAGRGGEMEMRAIGASSSSTSSEWPAQVQSVKEDMERIKEKLALLQRTQQRRLLKVFDDASGAESLADNEIEAIGSEVTRLFRQCELKVKKIGLSDSDDKQQQELKRNAQRALASSLSHLNEETRSVQKTFMREVRRRQAMMNGSNDHEAVSSSLLDAAFTENQVAALESIEAEAEARSNEINKIAKSVTELNRLFKELSTLVIDQGTMLDRIDYNIENVQEQTKQATQQLQKADDQQKSGSAMKCIFILLALIFFNLFIFSVK